MIISLLLVPRFPEAIKSVELATCSFAINRSTQISLFISIGRKVLEEKKPPPAGLNGSAHSRNITTECVTARWKEWRLIGKSHCILPRIMHTLVLGPDSQGKKSFILIFN